VYIPNQVLLSRILDGVVIVER